MLWVPPVGLRVDQHAKADKNVRAPVARANNVGTMRDPHFEGSLDLRGAGLI